MMKEKHAEKNQEYIETLEKRCSQLMQSNIKLKEELNTLSSDEFFDIRKSSLWKWFKRIYRFKKNYLSNDSRISIKINRFFKAFKQKKERNVRTGKINIPNKKSIGLNNNLIFISYERPQVSIIIPVYNGWEMTYSCLNSILSNTKNVPYEIILADDNSSDETINAEKHTTNVQCIRNTNNLGFLKNCNNAATFSKAPFLLFLNNDTIVTENWLAPMLSVMEKNKDVGLVGSKLIYPSGKLQEAGGIVWNDASGCNYGHNGNPCDPSFNYLKEVDYVSGACMLIRTTDWKSIGGFDERFSPAYYEDTDLAFSIRKLGLKVMYQPRSEVFHFESYSYGKSHLSKKALSMKANQIKFFEKWGSVLIDNHFSPGENMFFARDRSKDKKTILVIDQYAPKYDRDAGSKTTLSQIKLFIELGYNVKFIGDNFECEEPYVSFLESLGVEVLYGYHYKKSWSEWLETNGYNLDIAYLNRPEISLKYIDQIKKFSRAKIVFFGHDLHFLREKRKFLQDNNPDTLQVSNFYLAKERSLFNLSDVIVTPNRYEAEIIKDMDSSYNVKVHALYYFHEKANKITDFSNRQNLLFVGGFHHLPNSDGILWFFNEVWHIVTNRIPSIRLVIVGSFVTKEVLDLSCDNIEIKQNLSEAELYEEYKKARIVPIPLRYGAGVKGKTLEAMSKGLPIVSTSIGLEGIDEVLNFIVPKDDPISFAEEIISLYHDLERLEFLSERATNCINKNYNVDVALKSMKEILSF